MRKISAPFVMVVSVMLSIFAMITVFGSVSLQRSGQTFGLVCMTMTNDFYKVIQTELNAATRQNGDTLMTLDPQLSLDKQIEQIYWLIDQGVDGLYINPIDSLAIQEPVQKAWEAGIPVVILDAPLVDDTMAISTIASDNWQAGTLCAQNMMEKTAGANIGLLLHSEVESARDRIAGFKSAIDGHPSYEIAAEGECQGQLELAMPVAEKMLEEHPEINVIMALNDPAAMGALGALESLGRSDVLVYGVDGTPDVKSRLAVDSSMQATSAQSPITIGRKAAATMYEWLQEGTTEKEQILDVDLITRDNLSSYPVSRWQ